MATTPSNVSTIPVATTPAHPAKQAKPTTLAESLIPRVLSMALHLTEAGKTPHASVIARMLDASETTVKRARRAIKADPGKYGAWPDDPIKTASETIDIPAPHSPPASAGQPAGDGGGRGEGGEPGPDRPATKIAGKFYDSVPEMVRDTLGDEFADEFAAYQAEQRLPLVNLTPLVLMVNPDPGAVRCVATYGLGIHHLALPISRERYTGEITRPNLNAGISAASVLAGNAKVVPFVADLIPADVDPESLRTDMRPTKPARVRPSRAKPKPPVAQPIVGNADADAAVEVTPKPEPTPDPSPAADLSTRLVQPHLGNLAGKLADAVEEGVVGPVEAMPEADAEAKAVLPPEPVAEPSIEVRRDFPVEPEKPCIIHPFDDEPKSKPAPKAKAKPVAHAAAKTETPKPVAQSKPAATKTKPKPDVAPHPILGIPITKDTTVEDAIRAAKGKDNPSCRILVEAWRRRNSIPACFVTDDDLRGSLGYDGETVAKSREMWVGLGFWIRRGK